MRKSIFATASIAGALAAAVIAPGVSNAADTVVTFTVTGGALTITAPTNQALTVTGNVASGALDPVTVTDQRLGLNGWIASAISTAFVKPAGATPIATIPATAVTYSAPLLPTTKTGTSVVTGTLTPQTISTTKPVVVATLVVGANSASWPGTVSVALPTDVVAGTYTGTVTHSVA